MTTATLRRGAFAAALAEALADPATVRRLAAGIGAQQTPRQAAEQLRKAAASLEVSPPVQRLVEGLAGGVLAHDMLRKQLGLQPTDIVPTTIPTPAGATVRPVGMDTAAEARRQRQGPPNTDITTAAEPINRYQPGEGAGGGMTGNRSDFSKALEAEERAERAAGLDRAEVMARRLHVVAPALHPLARRTA